MNNSFSKGPISGQGFFTDLMPLSGRMPQEKGSTSEKIMKYFRERPLPPSYHIFESFESFYPLAAVTAAKTVAPMMTRPPNSVLSSGTSLRMKKARIIP